MAKIVAPPAIKDLDGFIDLFLHPEKYQAYMQQLKEMKDAIVESLDVLDTKEKADAHLHEAHAKHAEATTTLADARVAVEKAAAECEAARRDADAYVKAARTSADAMLADATKREHTIAEQAAVLTMREQAVTKREMLADATEAQLTQRKAALDAEYDKLKKKKDLLAEIN